MSKVNKNNFFIGCKYCSFDKYTKSFAKNKQSHLWGGLAGFCSVFQC